MPVSLKLQRILEDRHHLLSLGEAIHVATSVLRALLAVHDQALFHCDLTPANIRSVPPRDKGRLAEREHQAPTVISPESVVKILDFGIAVQKTEQAEGKPSSTTPWGTPGYRSDEQETGLPIACQTDLFQVARILEQCLVRRRIPAALGQLVYKAKNKRYSSATDMLGELAAMVLDHPNGGGDGATSDITAGQRQPLLRDVCPSLNLPFIFDSASKRGYKRGHIMVAYAGNSPAYRPPIYKPIESSKRWRLIRVCGTAPNSRSSARPPPSPDRRRSTASTSTTR